MSSISFELFTLITCGINHSRLNNYIIKITFACLAFYCGSGKFKITCVTCIPFLLDSAGLDSSEKDTSSLHMLLEGSYTLWYSFWASRALGQSFFLEGRWWKGLWGRVVSIFFFLTLQCHLIYQNHRKILLKQTFGKRETSRLRESAAESPWGPVHRLHIGSRSLTSSTQHPIGTALATGHRSNQFLIYLVLGRERWHSYGTHFIFLLLLNFFL